VAESERPSVLLAGDDIAYRKVVREVLEEHGYRVVGEASDAAAASARRLRLQHDICTTEIGSPLDGSNAIDRIAKASPRTMIVVLSRSDRPEDVVRAFTRGASGHLLKGINGQQLTASLLGAYTDEPPVSRALVPTSSRKSAVVRFAGWPWMHRMVFAVFLGNPSPERALPWACQGSDHCPVTKQRYLG
jgi:DNA-binding NarL/FixJ family response regulator